jgi:hypothetical protein
LIDGFDRETRDNITIERVWQDENFFEIKCTAESKWIRAAVNVYIADISDLAAACTKFPRSYGDEYYWEAFETTEHGRDLSFRIIPKDKQGHLLIEVYMRIKDARPEDNHSCAFYVHTEIGLLNAFGNRLYAINKPGLGMRVSLLDEE